MDNTTTLSFSRRFTLDNLGIRGQVVRLDNVWREIMLGRDYPADVTRYFGELACVAVMVGTGLKHAGRITLQIQGAPQNLSTTSSMGGAGATGVTSSTAATNTTNRAARLVVLDCTDQLGLRGMASSVSDSLENESVGFSDWVGKGTLAMTVSNSDSGQQYQSIVPISGLSVAECFEHYFDQSEQLPTHLWLTANAHGAGALMLQKLPDADQRDADGWARVEMLASSVTEGELIATPVDVLLQRLFSQEDVRLYSPTGVHSACVRDEEKVRDVLRSLGREELDATIAEYGEVIVKDDMCNQEYRFDGKAIAALFEK